MRPLPEARRPGRRDRRDDAAAARGEGRSRRAAPRDPELDRHERRSRRASARTSGSVGQRLGGTFVVMHSGNVGHAQDLDVLVRATTFLRDLDDLQVVIIGFGARHAEMTVAREAAGGGQASGSCPTSRARCCRCRWPPPNLHFVGLARASRATSSRAASTGSSPRAGPVIVCGRRGQRDGAGRGAGRLRGRRPARPAGAARARDPRRVRGRLDLEGDGPARSRVRDGRGRPGVAVGRYRSVLRELSGAAA